MYLTDSLLAAAQFACRKVRSGPKTEDSVFVLGQWLRYLLLICLVSYSFVPEYKWDGAEFVYGSHSLVVKTDIIPLPVAYPSRTSRTMRSSIR